MEWIEIKIETTTEGIEAVSAMLMDIGISGMQIEDDADLKSLISVTDKDTVTAGGIHWDYIDEELLNKTPGNPKIIVYVSDNDYGRDLLIALKNGLQRLKEIDDLGLDLGSLEIETNITFDEDWLNSWKKHYKPFNVGEKILIKPFWEDTVNEENRIVFNINPGNVFGTGLHQTTQLCIIELEKHVNKQTVLLDLGCGSGILSVISLLLSAESAFAVDIDPNAVKTAYDNAELNHVDTKKYTVISGNIINDEYIQEQIGYGKYDIVVANIVADVIISVSHIVKKALKDNGIFIASGIIKERLDDVYKALKENGFHIIDTFYKDDWILVLSENGSE